MIVGLVPTPDELPSREAAVLSHAEQWLAHRQLVAL